jgi:hypothetical protein
MRLAIANNGKSAWNGVISGSADGGGAVGLGARRRFNFDCRRDPLGPHGGSDLLGKLRPLAQDGHVQQGPDPLLRTDRGRP